MSREILEKYKIKAKKKLGQNFLVSKKVVTEISEVIEVENKNIIEVGPGYWALTEKLLERNPKSLHLVELDPDMIAILEDRIDNWDLIIWETDFKINRKDILKYVPSPSLSLEGEEYKYDVIANIPYYITSPILRHFLYDLDNKPDNMVILMQQDVWEKILKSNRNKTSVLSLLVDKKASVTGQIFVSKDNFVPAPKVESSVLLFESHDLYDDIADEKFLKIIKTWFAAARKKLSKNLEKWWFDKKQVIEILESMWYNDNSRWEDLNIKDWCELVSKL